MASTLNAFQQVAGLSFASNIVTKCRGPVDALQACMTSELPTALGLIDTKWTVEWGPVVWQHPEDVLQKLAEGQGPDNVWFVASHPSLEYTDGSAHNTYVVAISGSSDFYDFATEDFSVKNVVNLTNWMNKGVETTPVAEDFHAGEPYVAFGLAAAVSILLTYGLAGKGPTLLNYLAGLNSRADAKSLRIIFTGHSLGGALAPTLALALVSTQKLSNFEPTNISTFPSAGPSPGNAEFVAQFQKYFPKTPIDATDYQVWNCNIVNILDAVPNAWSNGPTGSKDLNLERPMSIYPMGWDATRVSIRVLVDYLEHLLPTSMVYQPLAHNFFTGIVPPHNPADIKNWFSQALEQHTKEYREHFGLLRNHLSRTCASGDFSAKEGEGVLRVHPVLAEMHSGASNVDNALAIT